MFVKTIRLRVNHMAFLLAIGLLAVTLALTGAGSAVSAFNRTDGAFRAETNEQRVAILERLGHQVEEEPLEVKEARIPDEFDQVYQQYNEIQKKAGFDLEKYRGKPVTIYTYQIINSQKSPEESVLAHLIVYDGQVIGGDIGTARVDGFMEEL